MLNEIHQSVRKRQISSDFTHMWNLRNKTNEQRKKRNKHAKKFLNTENKLEVTREEEGGGNG